MTAASSCAGITTDIRAVIGPPRARRPAPSTRVDPAVRPGSRLARIRAPARRRGASVSSQAPAASSMQRMKKVWKNPNAS